MLSPLPTSRETQLGQVTAWYSWGVSGEKGASVQAPAELELVGERAACAPLLLPHPCTWPLQGTGGPCPPPLGWGRPLGFPAGLLPSPPPLSHTRTGPGPGWHAGSHPGLADLHLRPGVPPPRPPRSGNLPLGRTTQLEEPVWLQLPFPNCLKRVSPNCLNKSLGWQRQLRPVC